MRGAILLLAVGVAWGQEFEVASIHPSAEVRRVGITSGDGEFRAENVTVRQLIEHAYELRPFQLKGGPGWIDNDRFMIAARPLVSEADGRMKLRGLLESRFGLRVNRSTEEQRVHGLVVTDASRLHPSKEPEQVFATVMPGAGGQLRIKFSSYPLRNLAAALAREIEQLVLDETATEGMFDFEFTIEGSIDGPAPPPIRLLPILPDFGLKLESRRGVVDVYTIEAVDRPTEN